MVRDYSCGSPLYPSPAGGLRLPADKYIVILTDFQTKDKEKMKKITLFNRRSIRLRSGHDTRIYADFF
jgi:hypothetical protein